MGTKSRGAILGDDSAAGATASYLKTTPINDPMFTKIITHAQFLRLLHILTTGSPDIVEKAEYYLDRPLEYLQSEYGEYCTYEEEDVEVLQEEAAFMDKTYLSDLLTGLLQKEKLLMRLDRRASVYDIRLAVDSLLARKHIAPVSRMWENIARSGAKTADMLSAVSAKLNAAGPEGTRLIWLYDGSDSFLVGIVRESDFEGYSHRGFLS